jgi:hypothetical protein
MADLQKRTAAYVPWATFKNSLDQLSKGMPSRIDRSVFEGMAWNVQSQLFIALKFFGLLKGEDEPTQLLDDLVKGTDEERKAKLKKAIVTAYADLIAIDLTKATRNHFEEKLGELYNVSGDTRVKAVRFFLNAAEYAGISLSTFIVPKKGQSNGKTRRPKAATPRVRAAKKDVFTPPPDLGKTTTAKSMSFSGGGTLTVTASADWFSVSTEDREFVFGLIDKVKEYADKFSSKDGKTRLR